tara:strand:- start:8343 stop:9050 length:708 start_codon:yes stop_codon:yes gene_type:complete
MSNLFEVIVRKSYDDDLPTGLYTYLNHYSYLLARAHSDLFSQFQVVGFDGVLLSTILRALGVNQARRSFDMTSVARDVFRDAESHGKEIVFVGGEPGISKLAAKRISQSFPAIKIVGCYSGFFSSDRERNSVIQQIEEMHPQIVVCGMGTIHQEKFLLDLIASGWSGSGYTCGGFFHQTAKKGVEYYPDWINRLNLRWLYRIFDEPKLTRRYTVDLVRFVFSFSFDLLRYKLARH